MGGLASSDFLRASSVAGVVLSINFHPPRDSRFSIEGWGGSGSRVEVGHICG